MEITLTKKWVIRKRETITKEIIEGMILHYYGNNDEWVETPSVGIIKKDVEGLYIKWEDTADDTRLDDSDHCNSVLKNCGWTN